MAVRKSVRERLEEHKTGKASTSKTTTGSNTGSTLTTERSSTRESVNDRLAKHKAEKTVGFDTFDSDLASVSETISKIYGGWQDADTMKNTKDSVAKMYERLNAANTYVGDNSLGELVSSYKSVLDQWDNVAGTYSQFQNADAYSSAKKNYELSDKYKGLDYAGVQKAKLNSEDADWLSQYGVNVGYSSLQDYNTELEDLAKRLASVQGDEKKSLQEYYDKLEQKKNQYEIDNKFEKYSDLMNNEDFEKMSAASESDYSIWDMFTAKSDELDYMYVTDEDMRKKINTASRLLGGNSGPFSAMSEQAKAGLNSMTEDEKAVYTYIYNTQGAEAARAYKEDMEVTWSKRESDAAEQQMSEFADKNAFNATVASALSVPLSIIGGTSSFVENSLGKLTGKEINPYNYAAQVQNASTAARETVGGNIAKNTDWEIGGVNIAQFAYDTGLSVAESALGAATFGKGFTAIMGMSSASQKAKELKDAGATEEQIVAGSVASGLAEAAFEKLSIDNLLKPKSAETLLGVLRETAKQMGIEASEEMFTEIANTVSDTLIRQNTSDLAKSYESYLYQGYTEEEAKKLVGKDIASNVMWAGIGGAVSGGVMGSVSSGANYAGNASLGSVIRGNNNVSDLRDITSGLNNDAYAKYLELIDNEKISNARLGGLYGKVSEEVDTNYQAEEKNAVLHTIANRANEFGEGKNAGIIASAIQKNLNNQRLSSEERTALESDTGKAIMQEIERGEITVERSGSYKTAYDTKTKMQSVLTTPKSEETARVQKRVAELNTGAETVDNESGQKIEIEGMGKDEEGNTVLQTSEGERLLSDVTLSNHVAEVVAMAEGMDDTKADTFVSLYKEGMDVEEYKTSFELAFSYGQNGFGAENVLKNKGILTEEQAASAYETGMRFATEARQKQIDEVTAKHFSGVTPGTFDDSAVDYGKINTQQKAAIDFSRMLSKATGVNIVFFQSEADDNGHRTAENGRFDRSTNTVYLDVYAGVTENIAKDSILPTLSHETTHWMKDKAPEAYKKLSGVVMDVLSKEYGVSPVDLVHAEMKRYKDAYGKEVSEEYAQDELIARASEDMLSGNRNVQEIISQMDEKTAKTFSERLKVAFEKIKEWLADLLSNYKSNSEEAKIVRKYADKVNELQEAWDDAFDKAIKANQVMQTSQEAEQKAASDRVQYSERETIGGGLLSKSEFAQFYEKLSDKKNGTKFPRDREGNFIFTIGNKLVYNNGRYVSPKISKIVTVNVAEDSDSEITYTSFVQEDIIRYETDRHFEGTSFEEFSEYEQRAFYKGFGREVHIESNYGYDSGRNAGNGLGSKKQVRSNLRINFENEQYGSGSDSESRGSESESVVQYSDRIKPEMDLAETIEQTKGMIAVHNLSEEKLLKTFSLGAFPMPSIAITKASIGHKGFGDISLLFRKDTIDPRLFRSNKVYSGDAWTPTYPTVSYKVNEKVEKKVRDKYYELSRKFGDSDTRAMYKYGENLEDTLNRERGEKAMLEYLYEDTGMMQIYLQDTGRERIQPIEVETRTEITEAEAKMHRFFIDALGADIIAEYETPQGMSPMTHRKAYLEKYQTEIKEAYKRMLAEQFGFTEDETENATANLSRQEIVTAVRGAYLYSKNNGVSVKVETDTNATNEAIRKASADGYKEWINNLFKGVEEKTGIRNNKDMFTPSGNRRSWEALHYEETLENVIKAMKEEGEKGIGLGNVANNIFGASTTEFDSIDSIREAGKGIRKVSQEEFAEMKHGFMDRFFNLANSLTIHDTFLSRDGAGQVLVEAVAKYNTRAGIANYLKKELKGWAKYSEQAVDELIALVNDIRNMPVSYFEAKPLRAVGFDEVAYAVIPDNASAKIKEELSKYGIPMKEYAAGDEDARVEAVNSIEDVQFSERDSNGNGLTREQIEYFKNSKVRDAEGNLLVMYHGTPNQGFTVFRTGSYFTNDLEYAELYKAQGTKRTAEKPGVYTVYLNIKKPFDLTDSAAKNAYKDFIKEGLSTYINPSTPDAEINRIIADNDLDWNEADDLTEFLQDNDYDYDGIKFKEREGIYSYMTFSENQIKEVSNTTPTEDEDIRYSDRDSEGNGLTKEQIEFFKNSKVRDENGSLKPVYHGSPSMAFTEFNVENGVWLSDTQSYAEVYAGNWHSWRDDYDDAPTRSDINGLEKDVYADEDLRVYKLYADIRNPFDIGEINGTLSEGKVDELATALGKEVVKQAGDNKEGATVAREVRSLAKKYIGEKAYTFTRAKEFIDYVKKIGYDGFKATEGGRNTYCAFNSADQVKLVSNQTPTSNLDIRYSERNTESIYDAVGELKRLQKENEKLKKDVERLRQRNRLERTVTGGTVLNENQIASVAAYILNNADSTYSKEQLTEELKDIYKYLQSDDVTWDILMLKATDAAQRIVAEKRERTIPNDYAKEILYTLRNTKVSLNETQKAEAKYAYGKDWYKMYFGRVLVTNDGIPLDSMWQEWAQMYPDVFDADMSDADMATEVLNAYDAVKASSEIVEAYDRAEMEREIAVEIYNQFWNVSPVRTLADKYEREIANLKHEKNKALYEKKLAAAQKYDRAIKQLKYEHRVEMKDMKAQYNQRKTEAVYQTKERYQKTIKEMRTKRAEEIRQIKEKSKEYNQAYRDRLMRKAEIDKITNKALKLNTWLVKNSKEAHVPEILKKPVAAVLKSLNFSSERLLGMRGGEQAGTPTNKDISLSKAFEDLATMVANINEAQVSDKDITEMYGYIDLPADFVDFVRTASADINNLLRTVGDNEYILNEMSLDQLKDLNKIISTLSHSVTQLDKALAASHGKSIANLAQETMQYTESVGKHKKHNKVTEWADNFLNFDNALPYYAFKMFGDGGQRIFEAFQDGWDKFAFNVKRIMDYSDKTYSAKEVKEWSKEIHEFDVLNGKETVHVKMTTAQIMSLYCLQKREQAKGHLIGGGIRVADFNDGKGNVSQPDGATLQENDINRITATLTDRQLDVANRLQEFMNTVCADWGNDVSMVRFGYKAFGEPNYFPITSDSNNLLQDDAKEKQNSLFRLLNMSFTKGTIKNANNRVVIDNIFDVFASHTSDMAKYNALALPVLDAFKWYNYKEKIKVNPANKDDKRFITKGVKQYIENAYGAGAKSYIVQFLRDINGAESGGITSGERLAKKMMSNYKTASVGANLRVAILQPTAYIRASVVLDPKYLSKAMLKKPQIEKAKETCGIALWKSMGFYDTNISKGVAEQIKHDDSWYDKTKEYSMKLAEIGDSMTWGYLYNACEAEVSEKQPGLTGKAKEEAIAKRLREVIYATQVVDSTMTRTQMMRNRSSLNQMLTSFMSEPMVSYNVLHDCYIQYEADKRRTGSKGTALKRNGKKISRAMLAYTLTTFASALAGALPDTLRDDEEEEDFATLFMQNAVENAMSDALGMIPLLKDVFSVMQGYSATRMDQQYIASTWSAWNNIVKAVENGEVTYKTVYSVMKAISQITGIPLSNLMRDGVAIWNNTIGENYDSVKEK